MWSVIGALSQAGSKVAWAATEEEGVQIAHRTWRTGGLPGELAQVLPSPRHFEQAAELVTEEQTRSSVSCGSDVDRHVESLRPYVEAGFEELHVANMGPHSAEMIRVFGDEVLPALREMA